MNSAKMSNQGCANHPLVWGVGFVAALIAIFAFFTGITSIFQIVGGSSSQPQESNKILDWQLIKTVEVQSTVKRNDTGISLKNGQQVLIQYVGGSWRAGSSPTWPLVGVKGDPQVPHGQNLQFTIPNEYPMVLIGGVGTSQVFAISDEQFEFIAPSDGVLWLGPNDDDFSDNYGSVTIRVSTK